jgi:hypothetical protein
VDRRSHRLIKPMSSHAISCEDNAEAFTAAGVIRRRYATHFIVSFLRFLAQSSRYKSISFW